jgi:hypothetical protein
LICNLYVVPDIKGKRKCRVARLPADCLEVDCKLARGGELSLGQYEKGFEKERDRPGGAVQVWEETPMKMGICDVKSRSPYSRDDESAV